VDAVGPPGDHTVDHGLEPAVRAQEGVEVDQGDLAPLQGGHPGEVTVERRHPGGRVLREHGAVRRLLGRVEVREVEQHHLDAQGVEEGHDVRVLGHDVGVEGRVPHVDRRTVDLPVGDRPPAGQQPDDVRVGGGDVAGVERAP